MGWDFDVNAVGGKRRVEWRPPFLMKKMKNLLKIIKILASKPVFIFCDLFQMEDEKMEWQARETATRCRVEELESNVQVLTADLDNDRQHICTLTEALETAERAETNAKNR